MDFAKQLQKMKNLVEKRLEKLVAARDAADGSIEELQNLLDSLDQVQDPLSALSEADQTFE